MQNYRKEEGESEVDSDQRSAISFQPKESINRFSLC
jgi:hypothetical protein